MAQNFDSQIERFKKGFPWLDIVAPAVPGNGIEVLDQSGIEAARKYYHDADIKGKCKFVPASGAASRMFKDIFAGLECPNEQVERLASQIKSFAFYDPSVFDGKDVARMLLTDEGLGYGSKPKGVLKFHRYPDGECRTAFAEHLVEGQEYMRNDDGSVNITFTISPEHRSLFESAMSEVLDRYEKKYNVRYNISFTYQDPETNTVAVDLENRPFLKEDGSVLRRPAGHGALIYNLNEVEDELVSIKNIDNVSNERYLPLTATYKEVLMGRALMLRDRIFAYLRKIDENPSPALYDEIEAFLASELCVKLPSVCNREEAIRNKLNRPVRVCGMVRNTGEPGGGPFIVDASDGSTSLQILEGAQIDKNNPDAVGALKASTHFNPVDLVCCLRDYKGNKFNLIDFVDEETGFISEKSYQGRTLKALELPGLWNGSMSDWNTLFVEVPVETFNPVKVVLDLLREPHQ